MSTTTTTTPDTGMTPEPRKPLRKRTWFRVTGGVAVAFVALIAVLSATNHSNAVAPTAATPPASSAPATPAPSSSAPAAPAPAASQPAAPATQAPAPAASQPATSAPAPAAPAGPTVSQQQALDSAQSYLSNVGGFSRQGLIDQLVFDKFSTADATWAADHSGADWNAQAVMSAKGYMQMGGFSRGSLIDQLQFDKYTYAQASYAASQVGL